MLHALFDDHEYSNCQKIKVECYASGWTEASMNWFYED